MTTRLVAGCMTGTSLDGLDVAIVRIDGRGLDMHASIERTISKPLGGCAASLRALADDRPMTARDIARLALDFAAIHIEALRELASNMHLDLIAVHGQTILHDPPASWQLLTPAPITRALGAPVVFDLRAADLAAGGQGAPITPIADLILFRHERHARAIINLGGFCNVTCLPSVPREAPPESVLAHIAGFDVCACNHLLDAAARTRLGTPYDDLGSTARLGRADTRAVRVITDALTQQRDAARSLGTGDEARDLITSLAHLGDADLLRSIVEAIAGAIATTITRASGHTGCQAILAGGGVRNLALREALQSRLPHAITADDLGIPSSHREAACMAILGALCQDRIPITLPHITHTPTPAPIAGTWIWPPNA